MDKRRFELHVVTYNCWGLLHLSNNRAERLAAIARALATTEPVPHIVALQEVWAEQDYQLIRTETRGILPFGKRFSAGPFGSGLVILSQWPIEETSMFRYPLNGRPTALFRGDWYTGKGVACARMRYGLGPKDVVEVFNTHLHTKYEHEPEKDSYLVHRISQSWELAKLVRGATERGHLAVALGDFNDVPSSLSYRIFSAVAPVRDTWRVLHPLAALGDVDDEFEKARKRPIPTAHYNVSENGATFGCLLNTWTWPKAQQKQLGAGKDPMHIPVDARDGQGHRIDYIFASVGNANIPSDEPIWAVKDVRVGMLHRHPELQCSTSDHFSVEATLAFGRHEPPAEARSPSPATDVKDAFDRGTYLQSPVPSLGQGIAGPSAREDDLPGQWKERLPAAAYDEILDLLHNYMAREEKQKKWRQIHFLAWALFVFITYIVMWFTPRGATFVLVLLSTLGFAAGIVDGVMSSLFFTTEINAIKEFEWEVQAAKSAVGGCDETIAETVWSNNREEFGKEVHY